MVAGNANLTEETQLGPPAQNPSEDGFLYHYTDLKALLGIVEHHALWATHIEYLNDESEHKLAAYAVITEGLDRPLSPNDVPGWQRAISYMSQLPYVACFTEDAGDRLSQWRGYGGSSGVCLQFRKPELLAWSEERKIQLRCVNYISEGDQRLKEEINRILDNPPCQEHDLQRWAQYTAGFYKDKAFVEEQEWRMVLQQRMPLKHRVRESLLIPYVEVKFDDDLRKLLAGVIVGPTVHRALTEKSVRGLMLINGFRSTEVRCSKTPYRDY